MKNPSSTHQFAEECIYTALLQLMEHQPYDEITITDITKKAGVSRMAYYRNYQSKDEILIRHLDLLFQDMMEQIKAAKALSEPDFWQLVFQELQNNSLAKNILRAHLTEELMQCFERYAYEIFRDYFHWDLTDPRSITLIQYQLGGMVGLIRYTIHQPSAPSPSDNAAFMTEMTAHFRSLAQRPQL